jgi:hypothetical protein
MQTKRSGGLMITPNVVIKTHYNHIFGIGTDLGALKNKFPNWAAQLGGV